MLKHARRLGVAAQGGDPAALADAVAAFLEAYETELIMHFREEEEQLLPLLPADQAEELTVRTLLEHVELHRLARSLRQQTSHGPPQPDTVRALSELLRQHVRMEEDQLFPLIERIVPEADLADLHLAMRSRTN
jgi:iron-sulfur cluster repair protein YtfE (RIC family)